MKTKVLAMMLLAGSSMFAETRLSIGIGFGGPGAGFYPPPPSYASYIPPCPGPDYTWVDGYWSQDYGRDNWIAGYWYRRPFSGGYVVAPRFDNRVRFDNHFNDRHHRRDFDRGFEHDRDRNHGNRDRFNGRNDRQGNGHSNGFRGH